MVVHPGHGIYWNFSSCWHIILIIMNSSERPGLVHRIDKDTSGLLVIAKTEAAMSHLAKQFEAKTSERVCGSCVGNVVAESERLKVMWPVT
jgi:23S rRNA pseudouridine1911/1915/1917 synthase